MIELHEIKTQCRITHCHDDDYLESLVAPALIHIEGHIDAVFVEEVTGERQAIFDAAHKHAALMLIAHWYENREAVQEGSTNTVPLGFERILLYKRHF